ncbi:MAG: carbohydrate-binding domain-containing protein [Clostridia bacterium]|nr:carbohydrate-binding domain-containing protein [Clostridia bacterium]
MKKIILILIAVLLSASLIACGTVGTMSDHTGAASDTEKTVNAGGDAAAQSVIPADMDTAVSEAAVTVQNVIAKESTSDFTIVTADGVYSEKDGVYTISAAGTYTLSGLLNGQILVDAGEDDEIVIELAGATVTYDQDSPIKIVSAGKVEISAKKDTENVVNDARAVKKSDDESQGEGAIWAKCDLKLKGNGVLVVTGGYNNGVHTTKDLTVKNLSLKVIAYNNAIKGNDSVTVESGTVIAISTNGDGIKTENTDANKKGETRGDVKISGGTVSVYAAGDGVQAAHDFNLTAGEGESTATVYIFTGSYSEYTAQNASTTSYKGVKVQNELNVSAGSITVHSYDDGLHADYGTAFEDGTKGKGTINISGGSVTIGVYAPSKSTAGGRPGRGGWGGQQTVSGADAIHADSTLNISGGTVYIDSAYEGLEANVINISGGQTRVNAIDDGVNATKGASSPLVNVTGGFLDVTVSPNGDTDGIDSNGYYRQSGGIVITRGPSSEMAAAIDADGGVSVTGGTLIILGYGRVTAGGSVRNYSLSLHAAGNHTVTVDGVAYTFSNASAYGRTTVYSDVSVTA